MGLESMGIGKSSFNLGNAVGTCTCFNFKLRKCSSTTYLFQYFWVGWMGPKWSCFLFLNIKKKRNDNNLNKLMNDEIYSAFSYFTRQFLCTVISCPLPPGIFAFLIRHSEPLSTIKITWYGVHIDVTHYRFIWVNNVRCSYYAFDYPPSFNFNQLN